jgi:hypothetical protein
MLLRLRSLTLPARPAEEVVQADELIEVETKEEIAARKRDSQETWDAFIIVMGVSLFPLIFASVGVLLVHYRVIYVADYDPNATTVKGIGRGLYTIVWFGIAGLVLPVLYGVHVLFRNRRERKQAASGEP